MQIKRIRPKSGECFSFLGAKEKFICVICKDNILTYIGLNSKQTFKVSLSKNITHDSLGNGLKLYLKEQFQFHNKHQDGCINTELKKVYLFDKQESKDTFVSNRSGDFRPKTAEYGIYYIAENVKINVPCIGRVITFNFIVTNCNNVMADIKFINCRKFLQTTKSIKMAQDLVDDNNKCYQNFLEAKESLKKEKLKLTIHAKELFLKSCESKFNKWLKSHKTLSTEMAKNQFDHIKTKKDDRLKSIALDGLEKGIINLQNLKESINKKYNSLAALSPSENSDINELFNDTKTFYK